jgi:ABC-type Zn uptake system ZnuABC Zn-binding protein ZnuA
MENIDRYLKQMDNIDAEYQGKIDKIKKNWSKELAAYWELIDREREKLGLKS